MHGQTDAGAGAGTEAGANSFANLKWQTLPFNKQTTCALAKIITINKISSNH